MNNSSNSNPASERQIKAWISLFVFLGIFIAIGLTYALHYLLPSWGIYTPRKFTNMDYLVILVQTLLVSWLIILSAIISWLFYAKRSFTRSELEPIFSFGRSTRYDKLLLDKFFPN